MQPTRETLLALRERVLAATGADQELDARLLCALLAPADAYVEQSRFNARWCIHTPTAGRAPGSRLWNEPRALREDGRGVTASVDASLTFVEQALQGHRAGFQPCIGGAFRGHIIAVTDTSADLAADARAATPALAILAALLTALASQEATHV